MSQKEHVCLDRNEHTGHLCVLASKDKFEEIKKLVTNPKFLCLIAAGWRIQAKIYVTRCRLIKNKSSRQ